MAISPELDQHLEGMAQRYGVDPLIYRRLLGVESGTNPQSPDSPKGAVGIGQVMPDTFTDVQRALPHLKDIRDPFDNAEASAYYLRTMLDKFGNDYTKAVAAYNAGPGAVEKYGGIPPFAETRAHVKNVLTIGAEKTPSTWDKVSSYPRAMLAGAMSNLASIPKSFSIGPYAEQADISQATPLSSGKAFYTPQGRLVTQSQVEKSKQYLETAAHPEQGLGYRIGEAMMPDESRVLPGVKDSLGYNVARTLGQGVGMAGQYLATRKVAGVTPAMTGTTVSAMSQEESEMYKRGREQGKDPATSARAAAEASKLGWLDTAGAVPMLEMLMRYTPGGASKFTSSLVRLAAKHPRTTAGMLTAAEELATEIPQSLLEDEIAKKYFGEVTDAWKTAGETAAVTSISSFMLGTMLTALGIRAKTGGWKLPKERSTTPITEDQPPKVVVPEEGTTPPVSTLQEEPPTATPNLAQADVHEFGKLISGMEFQKRKEAQGFVDEMKGLRPSLQLEIVGKEITTKQDTKKHVAPFSVNVKSILPFDAEAAMTAQPEPTEYTGLPPHLVAPPSFTPQPGAGEVQAQKEQAMLRDLGVGTSREGIPQPPETQVTPVPPASNLATTKVPTHPIQQYLGQTYKSFQYASFHASKAKRETGITLYPHATESGYVLRQARQGVYPVNTVARPSEMTPEQLREQIITPDGKTQRQVDNDMVAAMRAELEARKAAEQTPATQAPATPTAPYSESERLAGRVTPETKADVTEQITRPGKRVEAPVQEGTIPESDPIIENAPKGMMARKLYLKRLGPGAKNYTVTNRGEIVKLYSFDPFSYLSDQNWTSKMALAVEKDTPNWPKQITKDFLVQRLEKMAGAGQFKKEEWEDTIRMTGMKQWMNAWPGGKVPRESVLEWLKENGIQVEERVYSKSSTKHEPYTLPGGSNYIELVLTSPQAQLMESDPGHFVEGQGAEQIGWIRGKEFTDSQGRRVFHIEEVQSKRHQEGRKKGYGEQWTEWGVMSADGVLETHRSQAEAQAAVDRMLREDPSYEVWVDEAPEDFPKGGQAPDAPFRKSWPTLLLRRALKYAAQNGYDVVSWTTGEQQNKRYSLTQVANHLTYDGTTLELMKNGEYGGGYNIAPTDLPRWVGEDIANKLIETGSTDVADMEFGGQGMKKFYGSISPEGQFSPGTISGAMKDAAKPFKVREELVRGGEYSLEFLNKEIAKVREDLAQEPSRFGAQNLEGLIAARDALVSMSPEPDSRAFSLQPAIILTPEMKDVYSTQPMLLYTLNPFALLNKKNVQGVRASVTSGLPRDDQLGKITEGYVDDTVGWLEKYVSQSQWLVKGNPTLEPIFRRVLDKQADFFKSFDESLRGLDTFRKLKKPDKMVVGRALWNVEGKDYAGQEITENKYIKNGEEIELNPAHYEQYLAWAKGQYPDDIASVMADIRISLDQDLVNKWNRAVKPKRYTNKVLAELRHEVYDIPNYLPHSRYGDFVLEGYALDKQGNEVKVYDGAFDLSTMPGIKSLNKKRFKRMVQDIVPSLEKNAQVKELGIVRWNYKLRPNIPSDMFENQPVLVKALDEVVSQAAGRLSPDLGGAVQAALPKAIADVMKSRGEWGHFAQRRGIAGYETDDLGKVLYDYKAGLYGLLSKADAAHDLSNMLFKLDKNKPNEYQWAVQFVKDALAPRSKLEDAMSTVKALGFLKYISGSLKTPIVNLSNMVNQGVPTLAQWTGPAADKYLMSSIVKAASILRGNTEAHTVGEVRLINELLEEGTLQAKYVKEVKEDIGRGVSGINTRMGWVFDKLAYPMEVSERYSRSVTALAAYNAALDGKVNRPDLGLVKGKAIRAPSDEQFQALKTFAEEVTNDSHSIFGKVNKPAFARTGSMGKVVGSMYLFRHFTQNLLHLWTSMGKKAMRGDVNSAYGLVRGIAGNILLGGLAAGIPLMATFRKMYRDWLPKEAKVAGDDLLLTMKENLPDWVVYGVSALGGVNIGGSLSVDAPDSLEDILGVPVSIAKDLIRGKSAYDAGDYLKMTEAVVPIKVLRDVLTAYRMKEEGQTTLTGRPVNVPGEIGPRKITSTEAYMQVLGFKPLSSQKAWDIQETVSSLEGVRKAKQSKLANQFATAMIKGDAATQRKVLDEVLDWNNYWIGKGKPIYLIDLNQAVKTRAFAEQPEKRSAQTALEAKSAFGF